MLLWISNYHLRFVADRTLQQRRTGYYVARARFGARQVEWLERVRHHADARSRSRRGRLMLRAKAFVVLCRTGHILIGRRGRMRENPRAPP